MENEEKFKILMQYFSDTFSYDLLFRNQNPKDWKEERARFYFDRLVELHSVIEKLERYQLYFSKFYPKSDDISEAEAIEYHWHSYIQDFYTLQERFAKIIGSLKNDLPRYKIANMDEVKNSLEHLKQQIIGKGCHGTDFRLT